MQFLTLEDKKKLVGERKKKQLLLYKILKIVSKQVRTSGKRTE
jgi:hypothetical protein